MGSRLTSTVVFSPLMTMKDTGEGAALIAERVKPCSVGSWGMAEILGMGAGLHGLA